MALSLLLCFTQQNTRGRLDRAGQLRGLHNHLACQAGPRWRWTQRSA